jgi:hypothetical protein
VFTSQLCAAFVPVLLQAAQGNLYKRDWDCIYNLHFTWEEGKPFCLSGITRLHHAFATHHPIYHLFLFSPLPSLLITLFSFFISYQVSLLFLLRRCHKLNFSTRQNLTACNKISLFQSNTPFIIMFNLLFRRHVSTLYWVIIRPYFIPKQLFSLL